MICQGTQIEPGQLRRSILIVHAGLNPEHIILTADLHILGLSGCDVQQAEQLLGFGRLHAAAAVAWADFRLHRSARIADVVMEELRFRVIGSAPPEEQLAQGGTGFHISRGCHDGSGEVCPGRDAAIGVRRNAHVVPVADAGGRAQLHGEEDVPVLKAGLRLPDGRRHAIRHVERCRRGNVHAEALAHAEVRGFRTGGEVRPEGLRDFRLKGDGRAGGAAQLQRAAAGAVLPQQRGKGRDIRLVALQQRGLRGGVDVVVRAGRGERLVGLAPQLKILDGARLILRVAGLPVRLLRLEIVAQRVQRGAGGQDQRPGQAVRKRQGQSASADEGHIVRDAGAQTVGERKQRIPAQGGRIHQGLLKEEQGAGGVFLPAGPDREGHLGARKQLAEPLVPEGQHRFVAVGCGELLHHGRVFRGICVDGIAQLQLAAAGAAQLDGEGQVRRVLCRAVPGARFGENIPAAEGGHDQIGRAVVLLQADASGFAAAQPDALHLAGAQAIGLHAQIQQQLAVFIRAQIAHPEDRVTCVGGDRLLPAAVQRIGHRDRRAAERPVVRAEYLNAKLMRGQHGDAEARPGVFALFQLPGCSGKAGGRAVLRRLHVGLVQGVPAPAHRSQIGLVIAADGADDLPDFGFGLQHAAAGCLTPGVAHPAVLKQTDAVENRQTVLLELRLKAGKGVFRLEQRPFGIRGLSRVQLFQILNRAQHTAHLV